MELSERIKIAKVNVENDIVAKELKRQKRMANYRNKLKDLAPRISKLISTANELIDNGFYEEFLKTNDDFEKHGFCSDGWTHKVGFIPTNRENGGKIEFMGIINGGACGEHDFHTNGEVSYMTTKWYGLEPSDMELKEENVKRFLEEFDDFVTRFYIRLDKFLAEKGA